MFKKGAILERLTLALETLGQWNALSGDTDALIGRLERLTLALKSSDQQVMTESVPADADNDGGNSE